jgi:centromeric protein E
VRPAVDHAEETLHTLRFAVRATKVTNRVMVNEVLTPEAHIKRLQTEVHELTTMLQRQERLLLEVGERGGKRKLAIFNLTFTIAR